MDFVKFYVLYTYIIVFFSFLKFGFSEIKEKFGDEKRFFIIFVSLLISLAPLSFPILIAFGLYDQYSLKYKRYEQLLAIKIFQNKKNNFDKENDGKISFFIRNSEVDNIHDFCKFLIKKKKQYVLVESSFGEDTNCVKLTISSKPYYSNDSRKILYI